MSCDFQERASIADGAAIRCSTLPGSYEALSARGGRLLSMLRVDVVRP